MNVRAFALFLVGCVGRHSTAADGAPESRDAVAVRMRHADGKVSWSITNGRSERIAVFAFPPTGFESETGDCAYTAEEGALLVLRKTFQIDDRADRIVFPGAGTMLGPGESVSGAFPLENPVMMAIGAREGERVDFSRAVMEVGWLLDPTPKHCSRDGHTCTFSDETLRKERLVRSAVVPF